MEWSGAQGLKRRQNQGQNKKTGTTQAAPHNSVALPSLDSADLAPPINSCHQPAFLIIITIILIIVIILITITIILIADAFNWFILKK